MNSILLQLLVTMGAQLGIPALLAIIQVELANNPTASANERIALMAFADSIYRQYGIAVPAHA